MGIHPARCLLDVERTLVAQMITPGSSYANRLPRLNDPPTARTLQGSLLLSPTWTILARPHIRIPQTGKILNLKIFLDPPMKVVDHMISGNVAH